MSPHPAAITDRCDSLTEQRNVASSRSKVRGGRHTFNELKNSMPVRDSPRACASSEKKNSWRLAARPRLAREAKMLQTNPTRSFSITFLHSSMVHSRLASRHVFASARMARRDARWPLVATKFSKRRPPVIPAKAIAACLAHFRLTAGQPVEPAAAFVHSSSMSSMLNLSWWARMAISTESNAAATSETSICRAIRTAAAKHTVHYTDICHHPRHRLGD